MAGTAMTHEKWFMIRAHGKPPQFAFGTDTEAKIYTALLNEGRRGSTYSATKIPDDECKTLDSGDNTDGFRLDDAIDCASQQ